MGSSLSTGQSCRGHTSSWSHWMPFGVTKMTSASWWELWLLPFLPVDWLHQPLNSIFSKVKQMPGTDFFFFGRCPKPVPMGVVGPSLTALEGVAVWLIQTLILGLEKWVGQCELHLYQLPHKQVFWTSETMWSLIPSENMGSCWRWGLIWGCWSLLTQR